MTPDEAVREARAGQLRPVYLVAGEEGYLVAEVVKEIRQAALAGSPLGLNDDQLDAADTAVDVALATARTLPMMAKRRFVSVRGIERWDAPGEHDAPVAAPVAARPEPGDPEGEKAGNAGRRTKGAAPESAADKLLGYAEKPSETTVLVLTAAKLDNRRRLPSIARKAGWLVACEPLGRAELPRYIAERATARGYKLDPGIADLLAELAGPELAFVNDALERVGLYAGVGGTITEKEVSDCLVSVRPTTVWELVSAVGRRDVGAALKHLSSVYDPQDRGLRLVGVLAWAARQLLHFEAELRAGRSPADAAKAAGAPPFKARELANDVKRMPRRDIERWLETLGGIDLRLKGGSRLPPRAVLEMAILELCSPVRGKSVSIRDS